VTAARDALAAAFDDAIRQVDRALVASGDGGHTASGEPAAPYLARLRAALVQEREAALARGAVDGAWVRDTVRAVAEWTPHTELALLAALGGIARAGGVSAPDDDGAGSVTADGGDGVD
jgi:hypothetical protein